jgi:hypothetical protein
MTSKTHHVLIVTQKLNFLAATFVRVLKIFNYLQTSTQKHISFKTFDLHLERDMCTFLEV